MAKLFYLSFLASCIGSVVCASCARHEEGCPELDSGLAAVVVAAANTTAVNGTLSDRYLASAWYPSWVASSHPPESLPWDKYDLMTFSFALTTPDSSVLELDSDSKQLLPRFVQQAKQHDVRASVSIGGWTGSRYFSSAVATAENRTAFVKAVVGLATTYDLDGLDFDWEFPNKQGLGCNVLSSSDSENYLKFLQELRKDPVGASLILTAAVGIAPFIGSDGQPMSDVSEFAKVFDYIAIMAYDIWGSWSATVGPNAPLDDSCAPTKAGSATSAVSAWTAAKFPANQIVLGVPAYGRSYYVENAFTATGELSPYSAFDKSKQPLGENETAGTVPDQCGVPTGPSGIFNFEGLVKAGFLTANGTVSTGIVYKFDTCSQTPFAYNPTTKVMISYDDAVSFAAKGKFIEDKGLKGFAMWHAAGDQCTILVDAVSTVLKIEATEFQEC